jgi:putative peptidoglycan lipid II flippase
VNWPSGLIGLLLQAGLSAALGLGLYGLLASLAGVPEARQMLGSLARRLPGRS